MTGQGGLLKKNQGLNPRADMQPLVIKDAQAAIQTAILVNGGAALSVLAFVGTLAGPDHVGLDRLGGVIFSLIFFAAGVAAGGLCSLLAYVTNRSILEEAATMRRTANGLEETDQSKRWKRIAKWANWIAVVSGLVALAVFVAGVVSIYLSLSEMI
jgi:hypothetical protein